MIKTFEVGKKYIMDNLEDLTYEVLAVTKKYVIFKDKDGYEDCELIEDLTLSRWSEVKPKLIKKLEIGLYYDSWNNLQTWNDGQYLTKIGSIIVKTDFNHDMKTELEFKYEVLT